MRIAIVEDEAVVARRLERDVRRVLADRIETLTMLPVVDEARAHFRAHPLDLVFLDLNLNGEDGFGLLAEAAASRFQTIVVSAYEDQALRAFEHGVLDFVPKPWTHERLARAIERAIGARAPEAGRAARLTVRNAGGLEFVELGDVVAIRGADDFSELLLADGTTRLHDKTLAALEALLPAAFARVHRSWIVRLDRVRGWRPAPGGRATLELGTIEAPVGRTYRASIARRLDPDRRDGP